jgi:23S rRNA (uracil1939-C5)-methyltransferase
MPAITIDRLAFGGAGFGRIDGKACFVPYTAPGDLAEITIIRDKSSYCEGMLTGIAKPAACRVPPVCPVFGNCGGCNWQHIAYDEQCRQKEQIFADTLWRSARLGPEKIRPLLRADSPFAYRQRIQLKVNSAAGKLAIGFYRAGSHFVIDIGDCCPIAMPAVNAALAEVRSLITASGEPDSVPQVDLTASADGRVAAVFHYIGNSLQNFARCLTVAGKKLSRIDGISIQSGRKNSLHHLFGPELMTYSLPSCQGDDLVIHYAPDGFSQVNFSRNRAIVAALIEFCGTTSPGSILDLFCGNGNFSLPLARNAGKVVGFESFAKSVQLAALNASHNGIDNVRYRCMDSAAGLEQLAAAGEHFDLVIIDPPRTGAADVVRKLHQSKADHVIYISCDPSTLARDLGILQKSGYQVLHVQPVDMFPQTYHLESVTFLQALH